MNVAMTTLFTNSFSYLFYEMLNYFFVPSWKIKVKIYGYLRVLYKKSPVLINNLKIFIWKKHPDFRI